MDNSRSVGYIIGFKDTKIIKMKFWFMTQPVPAEPVVIPDIHLKQAYSHKKNEQDSGTSYGQSLP